VRSLQPTRCVCVCACVCLRALRACVCVCVCLCVAFKPQSLLSNTVTVTLGHHNRCTCTLGNIIATGSTDNTAILWDVETGAKLATLDKHEAEVNTHTHTRTHHTHTKRSSHHRSCRYTSTLMEISSSRAPLTTRAASGTSLR
jgi:WD40 repeat protein